MNACLSDKEEEVEFMTFKNGGEAIGGIIKYYSPLHVEKQVKKWQKNSGKVVMRSRLITDVLSENNITKADYLSIDTEGSDLIILKTVPLDDLQVSCISIENNYANDEIKKYMNSAGFKFQQRFRNDDVYVRI